MVDGLLDYVEYIELFRITVYSGERKFGGRPSEFFEVVRVAEESQQSQ